MLMIGLFSIFFAWEPNLNVEIVCSTWFSEGVMQITTAVQEFPPNEDFKILVKVEFLNGINY